MASAAMGVTKPDAGVMATRPATAPAAAPTTLGLPRKNQLRPAHVSAAAAVAGWVTTKGVGAGGAGGELQRLGAAVAFLLGDEAQPAAGAPDPVGDGVVDQGGPEEHEDDEGAELRPLRHGAGDGGRRDHPD